MSNKKRARNLGFIRWMIGGHKPTAEKLAHITNPCYISKMINGEKVISDSDAREIEAAFGLPELWLDRDNEGLIKLSDSGMRSLPRKMPSAQEQNLEATRSRNLDMIRWMSGGQSHAAKKLGCVINPTYLGKMAKGQMAITDGHAREIEKVFNLPDSWLDRDNEKLLKISCKDYEQLSANDGLVINHGCQA